MCGFLFVRIRTVTPEPFHWVSRLPSFPLHSFPRWTLLKCPPPPPPSAPIHFTDSSLRPPIPTLLRDLSSPTPQVFLFTSDPHGAPASPASSSSSSASSSAASPRPLPPPPLPSLEHLLQCCVDHSPVLPSERLQPGETFQFGMNQGGTEGSRILVFILGKDGALRCGSGRHYAFSGDLLMMYVTAEEGLKVEAMNPTEFLWVPHCVPLTCWKIGDRPLDNDF